MKSINTETNQTSTASFTETCLASCRKIIGRVQKTKRAILKEFKNTFDSREHLLRLALNEAEALAWQSGFPQLFFPDLAMEKAQAAVAWETRQKKMQPTS
jgi:hypothetical protein